ncbi:MAG: metal-dependent phosphohydrolase, partial [Chloroflexi bacterium]|nr:metal-dependent phosphohydrolase [Chloroflexota bacterium]
KRPYKEPWSEGAAAAYLKEKAGTHFDPDVAAAFLRLLERGDIKGHRPAPESVREAVAASAER